MNEKIKRILELATALVLSRSGDVSTEDGNFATVDDNIIIELELSISEAFNLESDDVNIGDVSVIRDALDALVESGK